MYSASEARVSRHPCTTRVAHLVLAAALGHAGAAWAQTQSPLPVNVASFNMAWAGTLDDFQQHVAVCGAPKVNWCETRARWAPGTQQALPAEVARAEACQAAVVEAAGGREASSLIAPCNAYGGVSARGPGGAAIDVSAMRKPESYAEKMDGLRDTVASLIERDQVRVIAFQEVKSAAAVRAVLGRFNERFEVCAAQHNAFQSLAFAWDKTLGSAPGQCSTYAPLAVADPPTDPTAWRRVRPGLALQLVVGGAPVTFMNLHLKSGCASATDSNPRFPARLVSDAVEPCEVLNRQVPVLEDWINAVAAKSPRYVLLGDWNRRIDEEAQMALPPAQVRTDGSNPAGRPPVAADGRVTTKFLWPELADGTRALHLLPLKATDPACRGWVGLDHIVISGPLQAALAAAPQLNTGARKAAVLGKPGQAIEASDHCPQVGRLLL